MTSSINPNNIDGAYPVAGQDNDSQGFRDNFTNIKTNFQYAANELSDLQSKAIVKSALTGSTLDNDMNNNIISNVQLLAATEPRVALGTATTADLNFASGSFYTLTSGGAVSVSFSNLPAAGQVGRICFEIDVQSVAHTLTLPSAVSVGTSNIQGFSSSVITFSKTGVYTFEFETDDGGTTIKIYDLSRNHDPIFLSSSEDLAASGAANLDVTTSYFSTGAAETATLAAGYEGQVKVLAMYADGGDMVVTVTNAGWKSSGTGTITFANIGEACTLMYINSKWFCTGNNGAVFA